MNESLSYILRLLLKKNNIKVNEKELEFQLESHPSYPGLHSLTGVLNHFGVDNIAVEVPVDVQTLSSLPKFFIAHCKNEKEEHLVLAEQTENHIELIYNKKVKENLSTEDFLQTWTGVLFAAKKNEEELQEKVKVTASKKLFYYVTFFVFLLLFFCNLPNLFQSLHFLLSLTGIAISVLIVQQELGINSKYSDRFCSGNNKKTNCNDVLNSKGAKLFGNIKLSDVGLIYFTGISLSWLLLSFAESSNDNLIIILSACAVPFTLYSIYYQYIVIKKWCPLCLSILSVLWGQALCLLLSNVKFSSFTIDLYSNLIICCSFMSVTSLWLFIYPKLKLVQEHRKLKISHNRFKNNYNIFESLISGKPMIDTTIKKSSEIIFGNKSNQALLKITLITNPLCGHCKNAHLAIEQLLNANIKHLQIRIRFNVNTKDKSSLDTKIAMRLLNIYHQEKEELAVNALHEIYNGTNTNQWFEKWNINEKNKYFEELKKETAWCHHNNINFTPEILVNGRSFPNEYDMNDLRNFVEDIIEDEQQKTQVLKSESEFTA